MAHSSFGNPGVSRGDLRTIEGVGGIPARVRAEVHVIHQHLADGLSRIRRQAGLSPLASAGGYNYRKIAGSSTWSNHAWGLAVDYNAGTNPHSYRRIVDFPVKEVRGLLAGLPGMRWGLDFRKPDPMHFEWVGSVGEARALTARLGAAGAGRSVSRQEQAVLAEWGYYTGDLDGQAGPLTAKARASWAAAGRTGQPGDWTAGLPATSGGHTMQSSTVGGVGLTLMPGDELRGDGHHLTVQADGVVALYHTATDKAVWVMPGVARVLALQADGNLVAYLRDVPMWWSGTQTTPHEAAGTALAPQSDGNLVIYRGGRAVWSSRYGTA